MVIGIHFTPIGRTYEAILLDNGEVDDWKLTEDPQVMANWCRDSGATVVAVDGPAQWREEGGPLRRADQELLDAGLTHLSTPTEEEVNLLPFSNRMRAMPPLYAALKRTFAAYTGKMVRRRFMVETRSHPAIGILNGFPLETTGDYRIRHEILARAKIPVRAVGPCMDAIWAALSAEALVQRRATVVGDRAGGFVVLPALPLPGKPLRDSDPRPKRGWPCSCCYGNLWVCEDHPDMPFRISCPRCGAGVGMQCHCNPFGQLQPDMVIVPIGNRHSRN